MARIPEPAGVDHPAFALVLKLVDKGRAWVKLSGAYRDTRTGPPTYVDISRVAWAYATEKTDTTPHDAILFDLLADWAPDEATRSRILVDNPAALYRFD